MLFAVPQGGLIALLLLLLVFTVALYAQRRWHKRRRIPQKSASTEATHEIHYIPSVLLGPQARESFRNSRLQAHNSVIGVPIRETPILDDYEDEEEEETPRRAEPSTREDEFGSQVTRTLESLGRGGEEKPDYEKKGLLFFSLLFPSPHPLPGCLPCVGPLREEDPGAEGRGITSLMGFFPKLSSSRWFADLVLKLSAMRGDSVLAGAGETGDTVSPQLSLVSQCDPAALCWRFGCCRGWLLRGAQRCGSLGRDLSLLPNPLHKAVSRFQ